MAFAVSKDGRVVDRDARGEQVLDVYENEQLYLNGTESYNPDGTEPTFEWSQITGNRVQLLDASAPVASFIAPTIDEDVRLVFSLTVGDGEQSTEASVAVDVLNIIDTVSAGPEARAGEQQEVTAGDLVTLDGSSSKGSAVGGLRY